MPFYKKNKLFFTALCFITALAYGQQFPSTNYTTENILPHNTVRSLLLDGHNTLWVGTDNGVLKKENNKHTYFYEEDGLAMNNTWAIAEDNLGHIWFGSYGGGLSVYDGYTFTVLDTKKGLAHNEITSFYLHNNLMYVGTSNGVSVVDVFTLNVRSYVPPSLDPLVRIQNFFSFKNQIYATTYTSGLLKLVPQEHTLSVEKINDKKRVYQSFVFQDSIYVSLDHEVLKMSLERYTTQKDTLIKPVFNHPVIWGIQKIKKDRLITASWGIFDASGGVFELIKEEVVSLNSIYGIESTHINALAYDGSNHKLFVATGDVGLYEVDLSETVTFKKYENYTVFGSILVQGVKVLQTDKGLIFETSKTQRLQSLKQFKEWEEDYLKTTKIPLPRKEDHFFDLNYNMRFQDIHIYDLKSFNGQVWVNTNLGMYQLDVKGELLQYIPVHTEEFNFTASGELIETDPYLGTRIYHNLKELEYTYYSPREIHRPWMVVGSLKDGSKTYLMSIFKGLYAYENGQFFSYVDAGVWGEKKLRHSTKLGEDIAISNEFGDIFIVNDTDKFTIKRTILRAETKGNTISFLKEYHGKLIVGTEKGLTIFDANRTVFLDKEQGLKQPFYGAEVKGSELWIATDGGQFKIDLEKVLKPAATLNRARLKKVLVNNKEVVFDVEPLVSHLNLGYKENTLQLYYEVNAHPYPGKLSYQYRLNKKGSWSVMSSEASVFLPYLPSEMYDIEVKITDHSVGYVYQQPLLKLKIASPYYKTIWFIILMVLLVLSLAYALFLSQLRQQQKIEDQKRFTQKRLAESKMESLLAQMNPHFTFNAMNSIQNFILDQDTNKALLFLGGFSKLIRMNLDYCTKPFITLKEEVDYLKLYVSVENERFNNRVHVNFHIDKKLDLYDIEVPSMLLQPFVENVFKHAFPPHISAPTIEICFEIVNDTTLECTVVDNGVGANAKLASGVHKSKGMALVKERLKLLGYNQEDVLTVISLPGEGVQVKVCLQV
ncbi:MAG: histidine kinase [Flavobacteriaceae bacterium]|nr:histidine kinase [Flavobacteriaceae bacterium]